MTTKFEPLSLINEKLKDYAQYLKDTERNRDNYLEKSERAKKDYENSLKAFHMLKDASGIKDGEAIEAGTVLWNIKQAVESHKHLHSAYECDAGDQQERIASLIHKIEEYTVARDALLEVLARKK